LTFRSHSDKSARRRQVKNGQIAICQGKGKKEEGIAYDD
jgi:hypothetical protein